jgi:hypothetical protein
MTVLTTLLKGLLQKDGTARIRHENPGGGKKRIAGAVLHFDSAAQKRGVTCHAISSLQAGSNSVNSTEDSLQANSCGKPKEILIEAVYLVR